MKSLTRLLRFLIVGVGLAAVVALAGPPKEVEEIRLGLAGDADALAIDEAGKFLYVVSNSVFDITYLTRIDLETNKKIACNLGGFGPLRGPRGSNMATQGIDLNLAQGRLVNDRLYIAHFAENRVGLYDPAMLVNDPTVFDDSKCVQAELATVGGIPKPVALKHNKFDIVALGTELLVISSPADAIYVIDVQFEDRFKIQLKTTIPLEGCDSPNGLESDVSIAYVVCTLSWNVVKVDLVAREVVSSTPLATAEQRDRGVGEYPWNITAAGPGRTKLYTADNVSDTSTGIHKSTLGTRRVRLCSPANPGTISTWCQPVAVTATGDGRFVFAALFGDQSISVICALNDRELMKFKPFPPTSNRGPGPMIVTPNRRYLFVSEEGLGLRKYDLNPLYDAYGGAGQACGG